MSRLGFSAVAVLLLGTTAAHAEGALCKPTDPSARLQLVETFPERGTAGHVATLQVKVTHGKGETLLPRGVQLDGDSAGVKAMRALGFGVPAAAGGDGGTSASVAREETGDSAVSTLSLPLVLLPKEAGTVQAELPELPLSLVQASGQVVTVCTAAHAITIVDPTANTPEAKPRDNPGPLRQREHWQALETALWVLLGALVCAAVGAIAYRAYTRRPKPVPPPPPPRPAWELALEALHDIEAEAGTDPPEHTIDRVTDVLRTYLGHTYSFDGLESTTEEVLEALRARGAIHDVRVDVARVLQESDLVKFASERAPEGAALETVRSARKLVRRTMPEAERPTTEAVST